MVRWTFNTLQREHDPETPADVGAAQVTEQVDKLPRGGMYAWPWLIGWTGSLLLGIILLAVGAGADTTSDAAISEHGDALDAYKSTMTALIAVGAILLVLSLPCLGVWAFKMGWRSSME